MDSKKHRMILKTFVTVMLAATSCAYLSIAGRDNATEMRTAYENKDKKILYNNSVITGTIICRDGSPKPVLVMAMPVSYKIKKFEDFVILDRPGQFMLYLPEGQYQIYALRDYNDNGIFEGNEVSGRYGNPDLISLQAGTVKTDVDISLSKKPMNIEPAGDKFRITDDAETLSYQMKNGQVVKIYDTRFCQENARAGWWAPSRFMKAFGANIFLTEPYDPGKIPVLFIHGAEGTPYNWVYYYMRLDKNKFQPWFYYYPSGIRLSLSTRLLYEQLLHLKKKHGFSTICITAHSMGGLIARSLLTQYNLKKDGIIVKPFITLASPWTGFESADFAIKSASKALPSWMDIASRSSFIKRTLRTPLPKNIHYYLFYGRLDSVSKGKALDERAYRDAKGKYGFDADHNSILIKRDVFNQYRKILEKEL